MLKYKLANGKKDNYMHHFSLDTLQSIENIEEKLGGIAASLTKLRAKQPWPNEMHLDQAITQTIHFLEEHLQSLHSNAIALLKSGEQAQAATHDIESIFHQWHMDKNPPSLLSMCLFLLEEMEITPAPDDANMLIVAAILGQVHNEPSYHNDMHFRKVVAQTMRMIINNNTIFDGTSRALKAKDICTLLSAACIHDIDHDGQGNFVKGIHIEGRAEKHSFELAKPYLQAAGCDDETLNAIYVMLLTTDVSPLNDPTNPMMQMKAAYRFHFMGEDSKAHTLNLSSNINTLEKHPMLSALCLMLHESDIATSAGLTYDVTKFETSLIMEEFKGGAAYPEDVVNFLDQICQRRFLSDSGQKLFAANMARIYALAQEDVKNGNEAYPASHLTNFILPKNSSGSDKTIN